jgi:hypothetical protein
MIAKSYHLKSNELVSHSWYCFRVYTAVNNFSDVGKSFSDDTLHQYWVVYGLL